MTRNGDFVPLMHSWSSRSLTRPSSHPRDLLDRISSVTVLLTAKLTSSLKKRQVNIIRSIIYVHCENEILV